MSIKAATILQVKNADCKMGKVNKESTAWYS